MYRPALPQASAALSGCMRVASESGLPEMLHALVAKKWSTPPLRWYAADERSARSAACMREAWVVPLQSPR